MDNLEPSIIPILERATHAVALWVDHALHDLGISQAEAHALTYLARHSPCAINDLHRSFGHKRSTLTSILDRLERRGWLRRGVHPQSRRLVQVELTDAGWPIAAQVSAAMNALEARLRAHIGAADIAAFHRVIHALEEELANESHE